jgi:DNA repair photolyase
LDAIRAVSSAGIPTGVMMAPVIPGLTDHEMKDVLCAAADAGATFAAFTPVRLPLAVADLFTDWLTRHYPDRKDKVLNRIRAIRGGKLNNSNFGDRFQAQGVWGDQLASLFDVARRKAGLTGPFPKLSSAAFNRPIGAGEQMNLF